MPTARREHVFRLLCALYGLGAAYHFGAAVVPSLGVPGPTWRHLLFALIDSTAAVALWHRPRGIVVAFIAFAAQQTYSHGGRLVQWWSNGHRIDWLSLGVLATVYATVALLLAAGSKRYTDAHSATPRALDEP